MGLGAKFWGIRGSLPTPLPPEVLEQRMHDIMLGFFKAGYSREDQVADYFASVDKSKKGGFGGNTSCTQVFTPEASILIDGGTGIRNMGYELLTGPCGRGKGEVHIFFTHFHWDHLIGLPFFTPLFIPGNAIHFYAVQSNLEEAIKGIFKRPFFPVGFEELKSKIIFHKLEPRKALTIKDLKITPYMLDHPDPCWGYKIETQDSVFSYCADTEGTRVSRAALGEDLPLYQGVDVMAFDAQYTLSQMIEKQNWGHAAATIGLDIAIREGIRKVLFIHHDPNSSDAAIKEAEEQTLRYHQNLVQSLKRTNSKVSHVEWEFVSEGTTILL